MNGNIDTLARYDQDGHLYDDFSYKYKRDSDGRLLQNRLYQLNDLADEDDLYVNEGPGGAEDIAWTGNVPFDPTDGAINTAYNYGYDELGNLVRDIREEITHIDWTVAGKVRSVAKSTGPALAFGYGAGGQRILKQVGDPALGTGHREHYIRDAQGNIMAVYKYTNNGGASTQLVKRPVYGSRRLGSYAKPQEVMGSGLISNQHTAPLLAADQRYELTDHLGNVNTVVTGRLLPGNGAGSAKQAEVVSAQGYEAFGMLLTGRNFNSGATRHGFNGKENDNEWHGAVGTLQDYGMRAYDTRVARFFAVDPIAKEYPMLTPYQFAGNTPIWAVDLDGLEPAYVNNGIPVMGSDHLYNGNPEYKPVIKLSQPSEAQRYLPYSPSSIDLHMGINSMATKEIGGVTTKFSTHNENFSGRQTGVVENTSKRNVTVSEPETFGFDLIVFSVDERIQKASIVDKGDFNGIPIKQYSGYTETITDISVGPLQMRSRSVEHRDARGNTQTVESSTQIGLDFQKGFRLGGKDNPGIEIGGGVEIRTP